jgi:predicted NBD/HSP70 family sugar kinase
VLAAFDRWLVGAVERLVPPLAAANCLFNPAGVVIGSRLPTALVQRLAEALDRALRSLEPRLPACAPIRCAALAGNAAAIGAALLPFGHILLPRLDTLWKDNVET